jgi:hypothetical protein
LRGLVARATFACVSYSVGGEEGDSFMARRSSSTGCGALIGLGLIVGAIALFKDHPVGIGIAVVVVITLFVVANIQKKCDLCGNLIKKSSYTWEIEGESKRVCPNCNRRLESRKSQAAVNKVFGED